MAKSFSPIQKPRRIDGQTYFFAGRRHTKAEAGIFARSYRVHGDKARITKSVHGYLVFVRLAR